MAQMIFSDRSQTKARLDGATVALALALFISPWLLDFSGLAIASVLAWVGAAVIGVAAVAASRHFAAWEEWLICITAAALIVAPWALDFRYLNSAAAAFVGVGSFVLAIS
ncbi:MAG TPA: SPW repeat protein, partial [Methylocystis sp.]|nr:SPW repeat protein [Methylocystis sp.]